MTKLEQLLLTIVAFALMAFFSYRIGFNNGEESSNAEWNVKEYDYSLAERKLRKEHAEELSRIIQSNYQTNLKNTTDHEIALSKVNDALTAARAESKRLGGLRIPAPSCPSGNVGSSTEATGSGERDEGASTTVALPEPIEDGLWSIVGDADQVTEQLRSCQNWIKSNGFYGTQ